MKQPGTSRRRRGLALVASSVLLTSALMAGGTATAEPDATADQDSWSTGEPRLPTPWTDDVSPDNALPEYPRPQLVRERWQNLNGLWEFAGAAADEQPPFGESLDEEILVPYPTESDLSGIGRHEDYMWYRRTFEVPSAWAVGHHQDLLMHFGAVDYEAVVYVNGTKVAEHTGGYGAFTADVTEALRGDGPQEVIVGVEDRTDATWQAIGKQRRNPDRGIFYEGASGIWQTVWMEPVGRSRIEQVIPTPDLETQSVGLEVATSGRPGDLTVTAVVRDGRRVVSRASGPADERLTVPVPDPRLWSPDSPHLYDLELILRDDETTFDRADSYFGMREIGASKGADGKLRITLNGKTTFLMSTLDQGYWPDGIYTAPTDEALRFDLEQHKVLGFNTVRKHIKTEPDRWYYHADKLGLMVWQDMPSMVNGRGDPPPAAQEQFESEMHEMIEEKRGWTSIIGWVPFNEGWGEWSREATGRIADDIKAQDPSRLVNAHSGVNCCESHGDSGKGDVIDFHQYVGPATPVPDETRVSIDGEHGGFGLEVDGHMWFGDGHAYEMTPDQETLTRRYVENQEDVIEGAQRCGISGAIYTQITDVEHEVNGFFTYDRQVEKMDFAQVRAINQRIIEEASSGQEPPDLPPGTPGLEGLSYWPADEGSGEVAEDQVADADLTLRPGAGWTPGHSGTALQFDGNGGHAETEGPVLDTSGSFTVAAWVRLDRTDGWLTAVGQDGDVMSGFFLQKTAPGRFSFSTAGGRALSTFEPVADRWYHLTGVRNAETGEHSLFVDGAEESWFEQCLNPESDGPLSVGRARFGGNDVDFWPGAVDEVRVWDRALTDAEIASVAAE